MLEVSTKANGN